MKNLIYDFYGIYIEEIHENYFVYENIHYYCLKCCMKEEEFIKHYQIYAQSFQNVGAMHRLYLVPNRYNQYISSQHVLFCINEPKVYLEEVLSQSLYAVNSASYEVIINHWIKEMDMVENRVLSSIMGESHKFEYLYALTIYYLGMAESSLAYMQDYFNKTTSYPTSLSLCNKRLESCLDWLNPFAYNITHRLDFISTMYIHSYLSLDQVKEYMYNFQTTDFIYMFIYMMYPKDFFNDILLFVQDQCDEKVFVKYYQEIEIHEKRLKDFYDYIAPITRLRPLEWL